MDRASASGAEDVGSTPPKFCSIPRRASPYSIPYFLYKNYWKRLNFKGFLLFGHYKRYSFMPNMAVATTVAVRNPSDNFHTKTTENA